MITFPLTMSRSKATLVALFSSTLSILILVSAACGGTQPSTPTPKPGGQQPLNPSLLVTPAPGRTPGFSSTLQPPAKGAPSTMTQPQPATTPGGPVSFSRQIQPLIREQCGICHIDQSMGGLSMRDYDSLLRGGQRGSPVVKGNPDGSLIIRKLRGDPAVGARMPMGGPYLPDTTIKLFVDWIQQGAPNN